jgi:prevent-host-death family protein
MGKHSIIEAGSRLAELIDMASQGEIVLITRHGEPVAEIRPLRKAPGPLTDERLRWLEKVSVTPRQKGESTGDAVSTLRDEWDR